VARHTMVISEEDPNHSGFIRRYFATVEITLQGSNWVWRQVDTDGKYVGTVSGTISNEDLAKDDALKTLKGYYWENP